MPYIDLRSGLDLGLAKTKDIHVPACIIDLYMYVQMTELHVDLWSWEVCWWMRSGFAFYMARCGWMGGCRLPFQFQSRLHV